MVCQGGEVMYPWLEATFSALDRTFDQGHGHHALLVKAEVGLGVTQLLVRVAKGILCRQAPALGACGQCHDCQLVTTHNHPDLHLLDAESSKMISIEQVRGVTTLLQNHAQQDGNKVVLIPHAEKLSESAANALLKTLEEPSENTYFLLGVDSSQPLMATIHSRCQTWTLSAPDRTLGLMWLTTQGIDERTAEVALGLSAGRPLKAKEIIQSEQLNSRKPFLRAFWVFIQNRDVSAFLAHFTLNDSTLLDAQLAWLESVFSDCIKCALGIDIGWVNGDLTPGIKRLVAQLNTMQFITAHNLTSQLRRDLREIASANSTLLVLAFLTRLITDVFEV